MEVRILKLLWRRPNADKAVVPAVRAARVDNAALAALRGTEDVRLRCHEMTHLDTAALQILLSLRGALRERGRSLRWDGVAGPVATSLTLAGAGGMRREGAQRN